MFEYIDSLLLQIGMAGFQAHSPFCTKEKLLIVKQHGKPTHKPLCTKAAGRGGGHVCISDDFSECCHAVKGWARAVLCVGTIILIVHKFFYDNLHGGITYEITQMYQDFAKSPLMLHASISCLPSSSMFHSVLDPT